MNTWVDRGLRRPLRGPGRKKGRTANSQTLQRRVKVWRQEAVQRLANGSRVRSLTRQPVTELREATRGVTHEGLCCQVEGDVAKASAAGFTVSVKMFGATCSLTIVRDGDGLRISASSKPCDTFCGSGGSFIATAYKKLCSIVEPSVLEDMTSRIYAKDPDYGPACKP